MDIRIPLCQSMLCSCVKMCLILILSVCVCVFVCIMWSSVNVSFEKNYVDRNRYRVHILQILATTNFTLIWVDVIFVHW